MPRDETFDDMADACILAGRAVMANGSDDLRATMRVLLTILGREIAQRSKTCPVDEGPMSAGATGRSTRSTKGNPTRVARRVRVAPRADGRG